MKLLLKIIITISLPFIWYFDPERHHICTWRCVGFKHRESLKFFKALKFIWT